MSGLDIVGWAAFVVMPSGHRRGQPLGAVLRDDVEYVRYVAEVWHVAEVRAAARLLLDYTGEPPTDGLAEDLLAAAIAAVRSRDDL